MLVNMGTGRAGTRPSGTLHGRRRPERTGYGGLSVEELDVGKQILRSPARARRGSLDEAILDGSGVVAFDFDGTLTVRDSFMAFLRWRTPAARFYLGLARLGPAAFAYLRHRDRGVIKAAAVREFLKGVTRTQLETDARAFAEATAARLLRPDALRVWGEWRERRAELVIVTASPEILVAPFARGLGAHRLIGTRMAFDAADRVAGHFEGENCRGAEKVRRLREAYGDEIALRAAYGDTSGDAQMLELAEEKGYRVFTQKP